MPNIDAIAIDVPLVRRLVATQFPQWAHLPIEPVANGGWDNRTFHLGDDMIVRLPSAAHYAAQVEKEQRWLPRLTPELPIAIPIPLAMGMPQDEYPWKWSIYGWIDGETASIERIANLDQFATALAEFLTAVQGIDATGGPGAGQHNFYRGGTLETYDAETRQAIANLGDEFDVDAVEEVWNAALASTWQSDPVWVHGDVAEGNLLVRHGKLCAVIDFGCLGVGDPACDLAIAWNLFSNQSRNAFRNALSLDSATWARGRGWVLWKTLCAPIAGTNSSEVISRVLSDHNDG